MKMKKKMILNTYDVTPCMWKEKDLEKRKSFDSRIYYDFETNKLFVQLEGIGWEGRLMILVVMKRKEISRFTCLEKVYPYH